MTENVLLFAKHLIDEYKTREPAEICKSLGISVCYAELPDAVDGFFMENGQSKIIIIKNELDCIKSKFCLAHELGHALMHKGLNIFFLSESTHLQAGRFEREADLFAAALLIDTGDDGFFADAERLSRSTGIPQNTLEDYFAHLYTTKNKRQRV